MTIKRILGFFRMGRRDWFVLASILVVFASLISPDFKNGIFSVERGDPVPTTAPNERDRVTHPGGFSLVIPPRWDATIEGTDRGGTIRVHPRTAPSKYARRSKAGLFVKGPMPAPSRNHEPDFHATRFLGRAAYASASRRESTWPDPSRFRYTIRFERDGSWFSMEYFVAEDRGELPPIVQRYLDTFRFVPPPELPADPFLRDEATPPGGGPAARSRRPSKAAARRWRGARSRFGRPPGRSGPAVKAGAGRGIRR